MRFFKLVGSDTYNYYDNGALRVAKRGEVIRALTPKKADKFDQLKSFVECDKDGKVGYVPGKGMNQDERITSREVYKYTPDGVMYKARK